MKEHEHCPKCGWQLPEKKERAHKKLLEVFADTAISSATTLLIVFILKLI